MEISMKRNTVRVYEWQVQQTEGGEGGGLKLKSIYSYKNEQKRRK